MLEQSLCLFGWVGGILEKGRVTLNHYLAVFDINQWYQVRPFITYGQKIIRELYSLLMS